MNKKILLVTLATALMLSGCGEKEQEVQENAIVEDKVTSISVEVAPDTTPKPSALDDVKIVTTDRLLIPTEDKLTTMIGHTYEEPHPLDFSIYSDFYNITCPTYDFWEIETRNGNTVYSNDLGIAKEVYRISFDALKEEAASDYDSELVQRYESYFSNEEPEVLLMTTGSGNYTLLFQNSFVTQFDNALYQEKDDGEYKETTVKATYTGVLLSDFINGIPRKGTIYDLIEYKELISNLKNKDNVDALVSKDYLLSDISITNTIVSDWNYLVSNPESYFNRSYCLSGNIAAANEAIEKVKLGQKLCVTNAIYEASEPVSDVIKKELEVEYNVSDFDEEIISDIVLLMVIDKEKEKEKKLKKILKFLCHLRMLEMRLHCI